MTNEHFNVLVVGAGISGIGAAYRLQTRCPDKSYAILEARDRVGGTWDLFRYPGVRSDSDMLTLGFEFNPWVDPQVLAPGPAIRSYVEDTAVRFGIDKRIRFGHQVVAADWNSTSATWTVTVTWAGAAGGTAGVGGAGAGGTAEVAGGTATFTCDFLYMCSGYYSYEAGYTPDLAGIENFAGTVVHPQHWPEDLDYAGKKVVVVGSGATAVTLVPALAGTAGHVTMLQRSPTYVVSIPGSDMPSAVLRRLLPNRVARKLARIRRILRTLAFYQYCRSVPGVARRSLSRLAASHLPAGYPVDPDFTPRYKPWDQRVCFVPDGDLFKAIGDGRASVVTATIDRFERSGVVLADGRTLPADIVVTATGLRVLFAGGTSITVDGSVIRPANHHVYRGFMLSGVPNFAFCIGYANASWTLRADLSSLLVCKMIDHMSTHGLAAATPRVPAGTRRRPILDLTSGYVRRAAGRMPTSGDRRPWRVRHNYLLDFLDSRFADLTDDVDFTPLPGATGNPGRFL